MPERDGTGPMGEGPGTGRGAGFCRDDSRSELTNPMRGRGFGPYCFRRPRPELDPETFKRIEPELNKHMAAIDEAAAAQVP